MNVNRSPKNRVLIMGIGNTLLQDDGAGVHVTEQLKKSNQLDGNTKFVDGGTLGLSLLPELEDASCLIVVDAGELGEKPGVIRVFENEAMDQQLSGKKSTVHELAMSDLLAAASLSGYQPQKRALIAIQPASIDWGLEPTPDVLKAIPKACEIVGYLARSWVS